MKKILLTLGFAGILVFPSLSQSTPDSDSKYSAYNDKHSNDGSNSGSQIAMTESESSKLPDKAVKKKARTTKKASKVENDQQYSVYNYKHPNKAAYAKKRNLDRVNSASQIEVVQNENYKHPNKKVAIKKIGVVTTNDKNKPYPNYKHQGRN